MVWVLRLVTLLAIATAVGATAMLASFGAWVVLLVITYAPVILLFAFVLAGTRWKTNRAVVGHRCRRAITWMLAAIALPSMLSFHSTSSVSWDRPLFDLPLYMPQFLIAMAAAAVGSIEYGRARYIVPMLAATPATMLVVTAEFGESRLLWIGVAVVLWSYAGVMVCMQAMGIARRPPADVRCG